MNSFTRTTLSAAVLTLASLAGCAGTQRPIETIRASGDHYFRAGEWESARDEYAEIVSKYPGDPDANYKMGVAHLKLNENAAARRALETAYSAQRHNREYAAALAEAMYQQGDEARLFAFLRSRASESQETRDYLLLGRYAMALNDADTARVAFGTAIEIDSGKTTDPYLESAALAERLGQLEDAIKRLRQAMGINPNDFRVKDKLRGLGENPDKAVPLPPGR